MNMTVGQATPLVAEMLPGLQAVSSVTRVICPPFTSLMPVSALLKGTDIGLGAQNLHWEKSGAYTGEVSPEMVKEFCQYVILGHSERRAYFGETDQTVNKKTLAALRVGLIPIVCVGETLEENESNRTVEVVTRQVQFGLEGLSEDEIARVVIAYEPVWAIGTGRAASADDANKVVADIIRPVVQQYFGRTAAQGVQVLYGGSVKGDNAAEYFKMPDIDGALVGGAALKAGDFVKIVEAAAL
jgi:triosephosphate isomerase